MAEERAAQAAALPGFDGLALAHVRARVSEIASLIGRGHIFSEYTRHDFTHISSLLETVEWVIPDSTKQRMTPVDWLMIVLAVYFHDLGMVVTEHEYDRRPRDAVAAFAEERLFQDEDGERYRARLEAMPSDAVERFIYQEFVREHHGERIRSWLSGAAPFDIGEGREMLVEIQGLLAALPSSFRDDLGLVCESHHRDDLGDVGRYPVDRPYANVPEASANLQYAALVLRTVDLIDITSERTPSTLFRLIDPANPLSQQEWVKQMAVQSVRSKPAVTDEGVVEPDAPRDTIEIHAEFDDPDGFFGLTAYLAYARRQLQRTFDWAAEARTTAGSQYEFPWRFVDDRNVRARGYLREDFRFEIDQEKVLDLLTGHTLYNRTDVVVRELIQNSLDAIRLQERIDGSSYHGRVDVKFDSAQRMLSVTDNGTGMTQDVIEQHLLRVGASRYQDPEFRKAYPDFSPISRFGIGVLSTFMVADDVQILTVAPTEADARALTLRSVHGRYLVKLLSKDSHGPAEEVLPHGTRVTLRLRPGARLGDVLSTVQHWIVVPGCDVSVEIDGGEPVRVGFGSVSAALEDYLREEGLAGDSRTRRRVEVRHHRLGSIDIAYGVEWSEIFRSWQLLEVSHRSREDPPRPLGTCVEGVRVEPYTPGFRDFVIAAIANATGREAPKTNVARSGLEETEERTNALDAIYRAYASHVTDEVASLLSEREASLSWATEEARWMVRALVRPALDRDLANAAWSDIPMLIVETDEGRRKVSPRELRESEAFWVVDSLAFRSLEQVLRSLTADVSIRELQATFGGVELNLPDGPVVSGFAHLSVATALASQDKQVTVIDIARDARRVALKWAIPPTEGLAWRRPQDVLDVRMWQLMQETRQSRLRGGPPALATNGVEARGREDETEVRALGVSYVFADFPLSRFVNQQLDSFEARGRDADVALATMLLFSLFNEGWFGASGRIPEPRDTLDRAIMMLSEPRVRDRVATVLDLSDLQDALAETQWRVFDPAVWQRDASTDEDMPF